MKHSHLSLIPKRTSVVVEVANILKNEIQLRRWTKSLPGQRTLCATLQISRPTLDEAYRTLQTEGLIRVEHGRRTLILRQPRKRPLVKDHQMVVAIQPEPLSTRVVPNILQISGLQENLEAAGLRLIVQSNPCFRRDRLGNQFETIVGQYPDATWVLLSVNQSVQNWFMNHKFPTLVDGFTHNGVKLPSIDLDHPAACRHAVASFLRAGYRNLIFLSPGAGRAGDLACEQAFTEALQRSPYSEAAGQVIRHDSTINGLKSVIGGLIKRCPDRCAILASEPQAALTTVSFLLQNGVSVPGHFSVISLEYDYFLSWNSPTISSYEYDLNLYTRRLSSLVIKLAREGYLPRRPIRLMPRFRPAETFAPE